MYIIGVYNGRAMAGEPATIEECIATMLAMVFLLLFLELPRFFEVRKEQRQRMLRREEEETKRQRLKNRLDGFEAWRNRKLAEEKNSARRAWFCSHKEERHGTSGVSD